MSTPHSSTKVTELTDLDRQMLEDLRWANDHNAELEAKYLGEVVLILNKQVIGHGRDEVQALQEAEQAGLPRDRIVVVELPDFFEAPR